MLVFKLLYKYHAWDEDHSFLNALKYIFAQFIGILVWFIKRSSFPNENGLLKLRFSKEANHNALILYQKMLSAAFKTN